MLSDSESESNDLQLTINEHYAKAYAAKKEREELSKLKETYGSDAEEDDLEEDSSDEESEDEDGEELTPAVDAAILRTLAKIKRKDPDIYDKNKSVFDEEQGRTGGKTLLSKPRLKDNTKPLTMKQHALSSMLHPTSRTPSPEPQLATHEQEQSQLRLDIVSAFHGALSDDEDKNADDLLVLREKTKDEIEREEEEYQGFLEREVGEDIRALVTIDDSTNTIKVVEDDEKVEETSLKGKKARKSSKKAKEVKSQTDQEFLMNYILNRGWVDRSAKRVPTYNEITHHKRPESPSAENGPLVAKSEASLEDEDFDDFVDQFESSYNFRFEEPGAADIPRHPRNISSTVRRQDTTRKEARERRKQRKEEELTKKKEEVRRMKALKMKELRQKLEKIGREGGVEIDPEALADFDLDGDWDPQKHDRQMAGLYEQEESGDIEKPQWEDDINIDDILPPAVVDAPVSKSKKKKKKKDKGTEAVADGVDVDAMDADNFQVPDDEEWDGTEEMRKRKIQEYMDEVYKMEFNDMIGDIPTRFHYVPVAAQSYSLTPQEILLATDADLNEYMGIKKFAPYRKDGRWDVKRADRLRELKTKLKARSLGSGQTGTDGTEQPRKRKGKRERQRAKAVTGTDGIEKSEIQTVEPTPPPSTKKRRKE